MKVDMADMPFPGIQGRLAAPMDMVSPTPKGGSHFYSQGILWLTLL